MFFKILSIHVIRTKVASALEGLGLCYRNQRILFWPSLSTLKLLDLGRICKYALYIQNTVPLVNLQYVSTFTVVFYVSGSLLRLSRQCGRYTFQLICVNPSNAEAIFVKNTRT